MDIQAIRRYKDVHSHVISDTLAFVVCTVAACTENTVLNVNITGKCDASLSYYSITATTQQYCKHQKTLISLKASKC